MSHYTRVHHYMTVMIDDKPQQRAVDRIENAEPCPRPVPVLYPGEAIVWLLASATPVIYKTGRG